MQKIVNDWSNTGKDVSRWFIYSKLVFEFAKRMRVIELNPMSDIKKPKYHSTKENQTKLWTKEQLNYFFNFINDNNNIDQTFYNKTLSMIIHLIAYTGMRIGEASALNWSDVNYKEKTIKIDKALRQVGNNLVLGTPKTKTSIRKIYVDNFTLELLKKHHLQQKKHLMKFGITNNKIMFINTNNSYLPRSILTTFKRFQKKAGLPIITIHGLRHTHTSLALEAGSSIKEIQNRLGHSNSSITLDVYTHINENSLKETGETFAKFIKSS